MLKLRLQYFGHLMQRVDSLEKTLMLEAIGGRRRRGRQRVKWWMASSTQCTWVWVNSGSWWWTGRPGVLQFMGLQRVGDYWATELNWTELKSKERISYRKDFKTGKLSQIKKGIPGSPWWLSGKESACHCKRHGFYPWSGRIPHAMEQLSPRVTSMEPVLYRVQELQLLKPWHLELMLPNLPNKRSHCAQWEARALQLESSPQLTITRESMQQQRPSTAKNKCINNIFQKEGYYIMIKMVNPPRKHNNP